MAEKKLSRTAIYWAALPVFVGLLVVVMTADPFPAIRTPLMLLCGAILVVLVFFVSKETRNKRMLDEQS